MSIMEESTELQESEATPGAVSAKGSDAAVSSSRTALAKTETLATSNSSDLKVEVFDPQQHGEGRRRYTSYCVLVRDVRTGESRAAVRRRYSAFRWLYRQLEEDRPGAAVPVIPHRRALNFDSRFSESLIAYRRSEGEAWINRVLCHPELRDAPSLVRFLGANESLFAPSGGRKGGLEDGDAGGEHHGEKGGNDSDDDEEGDDAEEADIEDEMMEGQVGGASGASSSNDGEEDDVVAAGGSKNTKAEDVDGGDESANRMGGERFRRIKKLAKNFSARLVMSSTTAAAAAELVKSPDEAVFVKMEEWIDAAELSVREMSKQAAASRTLHVERGRILQSMGSRLSSVGGLTYPMRSSSRSDSLAAVFKRAAESLLSSPLSSSVSDMEAVRAARLGDTLENSMRYLLRDVHSFRDALRKRREVQSDCAVRVNQVEAKKTALETIRAYPLNRAVNKTQQDERVVEAEKKVEEVEERAREGKLKFEDCCERVKRENERFRVEFCDKVRNIVRELVEEQRKVNAEVGERWGELQNSMEYMEVVGSKDDD